MLTAADVSAIQAALRELKLDGWLLYDFRGVNPVTSRVLGVGGMGSRRLFVLIPSEGTATAIAHKIELQGVQGFPRRSALRQMGGVAPRVGRGGEGQATRDGGLPRRRSTLPRPGAGRRGRAGAPPGRHHRGPSAPLVSRFAARWSADRDRRTTSMPRGVLAGWRSRRRDSLGGWAGQRSPRECELQTRVVEGLHSPRPGVRPSAHRRVRSQCSRSALRTQGGARPVLERGTRSCWSTSGPGAACEPCLPTRPGWGSAARKPPERVRTGVGDGTRCARRRDCTGAEGWAAGKRPVAGYEADRAARAVIERAGFGEYFVHRTGHSMDRDLHGSGPHLDDFETHDDRVCWSGAGFSVEPGVYLTGEFGVRSEINMYLGVGEDPG